MSIISKVLTPENQAILYKRLTALCWSLGTMVVSVGVDFLATNLDLFNLPSWAVVAIGLGLAQITKLLNSNK